MIKAFAKNNPVFFRDSSGRQSTPYFDNEYQATTYYLAKGMGLLTEYWLGGHADPAEGDPTLPQGGFGGYLGGALSAASLRFIPVEENPSVMSAMGMDAGAAGMAPTPDALMRLATGSTVSGQPASRTAAGAQLAFSFFTMVASIKLAKTGLPAQVSDFKSHDLPLPRGTIFRGKTRQVAHHQTDLSSYAIEFRRQGRLLTSKRNVGVLEYVKGVSETGEEIHGYIAFSSSGGIHHHSEKLLIKGLMERGIDPKTIRRIFTERSPCSGKGGNACATVINELKAATSNPDLEVTYAVQHGDERAFNAYLRSL
jgi:hypothetical protein